MSLTGQEIIRITKAIRPVVREEVHALDLKLDKKIEGIRKDMEKSTKDLKQLIADTVGALAESLDDTYARLGIIFI